MQGQLLLHEAAREAYCVQDQLLLHQRVREAYCVQSQMLPHEAFKQAYCRQNPSLSMPTTTVARQAYCMHQLNCASFSCTKKLDTPTACSIPSYLSRLLLHPDLHAALLLHAELYRILMHATTEPSNQGGLVGSTRLLLGRPQGCLQSVSSYGPVACSTADTITPTKLVPIYQVALHNWSYRSISG
ncbi:hypothetical protein NDU88_006888 [Pleurodeles waltl]|uniref:Uncharacterized protein n=1 Tax=Pleurodeles waltl TaxID=8319 RepID=A0AAV7PSK1_PLEWA|nr:hypothetical protein NDU88_006888 [Pleurodeles waltl]